ncbi:MAG: ribonuclease Y [Chloroflexi bacterium]|nr:ribonuclease Y [Chloroflexota bacterium]
MPPGLLVGLIGTVVGVAVGAAIGYFYKQYQLQREVGRAESQAQGIVKAARTEAQELVLKARDEALQIRDRAEAEAARRRAELTREEERLQKRRNDVDARMERLEQRDQLLNKRQGTLDRRVNDVEKLYAEQAAELQRVAELSREQARAQLLAEVEQEARGDMARRIRQLEDEARAEGERRARELIADAIQRVASEHVAEISTSRVPIPSDDIKGRIIGRNGRNIRAFEQTAGVDVVVDDSPESVTISCFDPVRREVARRSLTRLVADGRIHPAYIEKVVADTRKEVDRAIVEEGEAASLEANVPGLNPEILRMLGRLKFRTSYGQEQLAHAVETSKIAAVIAAELGANIEVCKAGGLLHDLGKAMDHEMEGTHAALGAEFCRRRGVGPVVVNCIASHHHEASQESVEAVIVEAADAISGARPGARRESVEDYVKRVRMLEEIANSFEGVSESYALQAGREIRVIIQPEKIDDLTAVRLSRDVAKKIEENMQYPGQIKVTVIRETRAVEYAK